MARPHDPFRASILDETGDISVIGKLRSEGQFADPDRAWWADRLREPFPATGLPLDHPKSDLTAPLAASSARTLSADSAEVVRAFVQRIGVSPETVAAGAAALLFARLAGESQVGMAVAGWPLAVKPDPLQSAEDFLRGLDSQVREWLEHCVGSPSALPANLTVQGLEQAANAALAGVRIHLRAGVLAAAPAEVCDFELVASVGSESIDLGARYRPQELDSATVAGWLESLEAVLLSFARNSGQRLEQIGLCSEAQLAWLASLQPVPTAYDRDGLAHEMFEAQVDRTPTRIAASDATTTLTYLALEQRANRIAHRLRARGVGRGGLVGIALPRGTDMLAALLGVLKAGGGYVPLDPEFPADRLEFMATDARLAVIICDSSVASQFAAHSDRLLLLDRSRAEIDSAPTARLARDARSATAMDDCFVVYTSGSTGKP